MKKSDVLSRVLIAIQPSVFISAMLATSLCTAGVDQPWNDLKYDVHHGDLGEGLILFAVFAFILHLIDKCEFFPFLREVTRFLGFIALMYLVIFFFLACVIGVSIFLQSFGISKEASGFIGLSVGIVVAWKVFFILVDKRASK